MVAGMYRDALVIVGSAIGCDRRICKRSLEV